VPYYVYIILCDNASFYTGYTKDVDERLKLHANGRGAKYTKMHKPKKIVYVESYEQRVEAMRREKIIKKLNHKQKQTLIKSQKTKKHSFNKINKPTQPNRKSGEEYDKEKNNLDRKTSG
jgi:putative endonuclease